MPGSRGREKLCRMHPVREALRARRRELFALWIREPEPRGVGELEALAAAAGLQVGRLAPPELDRKAGGRHQGVVLEVGPLPQLSLEEVLTGSAPGPRLLVALDGVEDPQNLGALARTAEAAGADVLVLTQRRAPPLSPAVSSASAGAIEHLPVARVPNLVRALAATRDAGFWVIGADSQQGEDLFQTPDAMWEGNLVLVLGAEERGLRAGVAAALDHRVRIPLPGRVGSLNVAAAGALLLFEPSRRRSRASSRGEPA